MIAGYAFFCRLYDSDASSWVKLSFCVNLNAGGLYNQKNAKEKKTQEKETIEQMGTIVQELLIETLGLQPPRIIISVTGSEEDADIERRLRKQLKNALLEVAEHVCHSPHCEPVSV